MRSIRQLLRQPIRTLFGIVLIVLAVAVLCICVGQSFAAMATRDRLSELFMTLALPSLNYTEEADEWALSYAEEHPEVVREVASPGLASAYIPELQPDLYTSHLDLTTRVNDNHELRPQSSGAEYGSAMFEITLTKIGVPFSSFAQNIGLKYYYYETQGSQVAVLLEGTIERVIGMAEGLPDPVGFRIALTLYMPSREALEALDLCVGERYLVYGTDYVDEDWWLRSNLAQQVPQLKGQLLRSFEPERLEMLTEEEIIARNGTYNEYSGMLVVAIYHFDDEKLYHGMARWTLEYFRTGAMTLRDDSALPLFDYRVDESGALVETPLDAYCYTDISGGTVTLTPEEYRERYAEPTIVHLEGSAEEFLAGPEGALWQEALENIRINNSAFPVIGVDRLKCVADFARGRADIVEGRDFTAEELKSGARVCILSQSLAEANGLSVGDTITPRFYTNDQGLPYQIRLSEGKGSVNPTACYYFGGTSAFAEETEEYTIVGLYRQDVEWCNVNTNLYSFTPNTIFTPKASVPVEMDYGYAAFFRTFVLQSGMTDTFAQAVLDAGYYGEFFYDDNGYSAVESSMQIYQEGARRAMLIGAATYGIILLLFLVLFPAQQAKALTTMESLGAVRKKRIRHVLLSGLGILVPGTLLGIGAGTLLWQRVVDALTAETTTNLAVEMDVLTMTGIAAAQLLLAALLVLCAGVLMTGKKSLMKRK